MRAGLKCCDWLARSLLGSFSFSYVNDVFIFEYSGDSSLMKMFPYQPVPNPDRKPSMWRQLHTTSISVAEASSPGSWTQLQPSWAPVPNKPTVSMDVKQHFNNNFREKEELELERKNLDSQRIVALGPAGPV